MIYSRQISSTAGVAAYNPRARRHLESRSHLAPAVSKEEQGWNQQIMDAVAPASSDIVLEKTRHSFFAHDDLTHS